MKGIFRASVVLVFLSFAGATATGFPGFSRITEVPGESLTLACHLLQIAGISVALLIRGNRPSALPAVLKKPARPR